MGEVARGLSLFGGASSEVRRCGCSVEIRRVRLSPETASKCPLSIHLPLVRTRRAVARRMVSSTSLFLHGNEYELTLSTSAAADAVQLELVQPSGELWSGRKSVV